jgi:hypothetical protein
MLKNLTCNKCNAYTQSRLIINKFENGGFPAKADVCTT